MSKEKKQKKKTNKRTNKVFVRILAGLLCVIIACVTTNKIFDAISESVTDNAAAQAGQQDNAANGGNNAAVPRQYNNAQNANGNSNAVVDNNSQGAAVDQNGNTVVPDNGGTVTPNGGTTGDSTGGSVSTDPLQFSKAQIVDYYNKCLKNTYAQSKFTVKKTEKVDVQLGEMLLNGKQSDFLKNNANRIVALNAKDKSETKNYTSGTVSVNAQTRFILPANLKSAGVATCNITKSGAGYQITMKLVPETCDFRTKPPYNSACTFPLDFTEINLDGIGQITSAQFYYPGTTLTATIDGNGRVVKTYVVMPLEVDNASGEGMGLFSGNTVSIDISGHWYCTNVFTF